MQNINLEQIEILKMASIYKDLWVQDFIKLICTNHSKGWLVNGEGSGRLF